jgi:hypothetical protein
VKVEEMIDWVIGEVKAVPNTVWRLNDSFAVLGIKGVLNMLNDEGCQELGQLRDLAGPVTPWSWKMFQRMCISCWGKLCESGGNLMVYLRLFADLRKPALKLLVIVVVKNYYFCLVNLLTR